MPALGYIFTGWSGDIEGQGNPLTVVMDGNKSFGATFVKDTADTDGDDFSNYDELIVYQTDPADANSYPTHRVTILGDWHGRGVVGGERINYKKGTTATLSASANEGYVFDGWFGSVTGTESSVSILMDSDKTVGVGFSPDERDTDNDNGNYDEGWFVYRPRRFRKLS